MPLGFTLIELVVVIAIIAVLVSLLLPVLSRAKQAARLTACRSNLRQWGLGLNLFVNDYGYYPLAYGDPFAYDPSNDRSWWSALPKLYLTGRSLDELARCPATRLPRTPRQTFDYGYNAMDDPNGAPLGLGGRDLTGRNSIPTYENQVVAPDDLYAFGDATRGFSPSGRDADLTFAFFPNFHPLWAAARSVRDKLRVEVLGYQRIRPAHRKSLNVVMADSHTESPTIETLCFPTNGLARRRWFIDHEMHNELFHE